MCWRIALCVFGVALALAAAVIWLSDVKPTVETTTEKTVERTPAPRTAQNRDRPSRATVKTTSKSSRTLNGREDQLEKAQPSGPELRSEPITIALLSASLVLFTLGALGRVPSKVSATGIDLELALPPEGAAALATVAKEADIAGDQEKLEELARAMAQQARWQEGASERGWEIVGPSGTGRTDDWTAIARNSYAELTSQGDDPGPSGGGAR